MVVLENKHGIPDDQLLALAYAVRPSPQEVVDCFKLVKPGGKFALYADDKVEYGFSAYGITLKLYSSVQLEWSRIMIIRFADYI